ncbi:MAG: hypothetical protein WC282_00470 [Bacilli bacterium]|jgi:hypothetical protein
MKNDTIIKQLYKDIIRINADSKYAKSRKLPSDTYFLDNDYILVNDPENSLARYPYSINGTTLWAYASGNISINNSSYYWILPSGDGKEPYFTSFLGIKNGNTFTPVSLISPTATKNGIEAKRYTVFGKEAAYYLTVVKGIIYSLTVFMDKDEEAVFIFSLINDKGQEQDIYLSNYFNCLFKYESGESNETKWFKKCTYRDNSFMFESPEDLDRATHIENYGLIKRSLSKTPIIVYNATAKNIYHGKRNLPLASAKPLYAGAFEKDKHVTNFTETAIAGDIIHYHISEGEIINEHYVISSKHDSSLFDGLSDYSLSKFELALDNKRKEIKSSTTNNIAIRFNGLRNKEVSDYVFNRFIENVVCQVDFASKSSNSGTVFLGVRDVSQQLEAALIWDPTGSRKKIIEVISFVDPSGRAPRQYSIPPDGQIETRMDLRPFIDQGIWIIDMVYQYLAYSGDYSILDEQCPYFAINGPSSSIKTTYTESLLAHLIKITSYLKSNIDSETNCLKVLFGDWNDALDGLGLPLDRKKGEYGNGVSVMASFQFYKNLEEMTEMLNKVGGNHDLIADLAMTKARLSEGLKKHAFDHNGDQMRIVHGWGDRQSYCVGSFSDVDGKSRYSLTANAFYVNSGFNLVYPDAQKSAIEAFHALDSKYGMKTFEPFFGKENKGVGRIINLPKGTAENGATYVHAALFGVMALYRLGKSEDAWLQIEKLLPPFHGFISTSPFVMPNSYSLNLEDDMDGESMGDWYTGSSNTLIKVLLRGLVGIDINLDGYQIKPAAHLPCKSIDLAITIKGKSHKFIITAGKAEEM